MSTIRAVLLLPSDPYIDYVIAKRNTARGMWNVEHVELVLTNVASISTGAHPRDTKDQFEKQVREEGHQSHPSNTKEKDCLINNDGTLNVHHPARRAHSSLRIGQPQSPQSVSLNSQTTPRVYRSANDNSFGNSTGRKIETVKRIDPLAKAAYHKATVHMKHTDVLRLVFKFICTAEFKAHGPGLLEQLHRSNLYDKKLGKIKGRPTAVKGVEKQMAAFLTKITDIGINYFKAAGLSGNLSCISMKNLLSNCTPR